MCADDKEQGYTYLALGPRRQSIPGLQRYLPSIVRSILMAVCLFTSGLLLGMHYPFFLSVYTRRPGDELVSLLPTRLPPPPLELKPPIASLPDPDPEIPNIVHYVYGLKQPAGSSQRGPEFPYFAYIGMRSAMRVLKPEKIMFHCQYEPTGYWWEQVLNWEGWIDEEDGGARKGMVQVAPAREVEFVGEDKRPVKHVIRPVETWCDQRVDADLLVISVPFGYSPDSLQQYGGIYLDIDTIILRPFRDAALMMQDTVLAMEAKHLSVAHGRASDDEMTPKGLCNAIIVARPGSTFIKRWLETYEAFDHNQWADHSVRIPWALAQLYPTTVTVLSERAFFWPMWSAEHIDAVYVKNEYDFEASGQLAYHLWESMAKQHLADLNPTTLKTGNSSFTRVASRFMAADEEARWLKNLEGSRKYPFKTSTPSAVTRPTGLH
ncbi:hypothetical protein QFC22_003231 [Naganishia vaughanmartiniae]|uniref:Uncharacterized protein n=1 Tax=Naganishia vaughanmartiniae TaxID=1424756 RepID=A0ACC2X9R3_9TREE|nr:hypothetical protein QFC22_003231 [Naganishia vaughanmartiniae]